jgi:hypothetical protein
VLDRRGGEQRRGQVEEPVERQRDLTDQATMKGAFRDQLRQPSSPGGAVHHQQLTLPHDQFSVEDADCFRLRVPELDQDELGPGVAALAVPSRECPAAVIVVRIGENRRVQLALVLHHVQ